jgi:hypothetical protein
MFLFDANVRGTGKTLLADVIAEIVQGRPAPRSPQLLDENEERKTITSLALAGHRLVLIDNIAHPLGSPALDTILTGTLWTDRLLGRSETVTLPLRATWYGTGNNIQFRADTARRCLHIRLLSKHENPEYRTDVRHQDLRRHTHAMRGHLVAAALTILRAFCVAGRPRTADLAPWGSFEAWSDLIRGAIVWLDLPDPGLTRAAVEEMDASRSVIADFLRGLLELPDDSGRRGCTAGGIIAHLSDDRDNRLATLRTAVLDMCPTPKDTMPSSSRLGRALRTHRDRPVDGLALRYGKDSRGDRVWSVASLA